MAAHWFRFASPAASHGAGGNYALTINPDHSVGAGQVDELENRLHRHATDAEMAEAMGLDAESYHAKVASSLSQQLDSIEEVYSDHDSWFADLAAGADSEYEAAELRKDLSACLSQLAEREALVLQLYFVEELNLDEIGAVLGVGAARVCQIKRSALVRMRKMMEARHGGEPLPF